MLKQLAVTLTLVIFGIVAVTLLASGEQTDPTINEKSVTEPIAFINVNVIPMTGEQHILQDQTVLVKGDRITLVGDSYLVELGEGVEVVDGAGKYLIPGLTEMHGHIPPSVRDESMPDYMTRKYVENTLFLYLANGITTVRGMLGYEGQLELREEILDGSLTGPTLYLAGPSFNGNSVDSPDQARDRVRDQFEEGWDLLKIHPGLTKEEFIAVAASARELGIPFGGHVPQDVGLQSALASGQISIDHMDGYVDHIRSFSKELQDSATTDIIQQTVEAGTWIVPTMALWETIVGAFDIETLMSYEELKYIPQEVRQYYRDFLDHAPDTPYYDPKPEDHALLRIQLLRRMYEANVQIVLGTDAPQLFSVPGFSLHREIPLMKLAGMTDQDILRSATAEGGRYFMDKDRFGTIELGARADLLLLEQNPLEDLDALQNPSAVMVRGSLLTREFIDKQLELIEQSYR